MDRDTIAKNWKVTSEGSTAPIENGSTRQLQWLLHIEVSWWMGICSHMKSSDAECRERSQVLAQCLYNTMQGNGCTMPVQCNAMVAQRTRPCTIMWLQGSSARKNLWSLWSLWSLDKGVSEGELWALWRRKNLATWLIYYSGCNPLAHNGLSDTQRSGEQILWNLVYLVHAAVSITAQNKKKTRK